MNVPRCVLLSREFLTSLYSGRTRQLHGPSGLISVGSKILLIDYTDRELLARVVLEVPCGDHSHYWIRSAP
jgi:hypothetical protein